MAQKLFHVWYRREFECYVVAEDEAEARTAAERSESWQVASQTGELWGEFFEVSEAEGPERMESDAERESQGTQP